MAATLRLWPSLPPAVHVRRPTRPLPFPLEEPDCRLYERGRHALWHGVRALGLVPGDEVLVPAYNCGTEIEALVRAGLVCRFYEATDTLVPDERELDSLVTPRTRALLLIHYFGFPQDAPRWRTWCDRRSLRLIEDCAHALFATVAGRPVGSFGHLAIFSLVKTLPLPDGGAAFAAGPPPPPSGSGRLRLDAVAKRHARWAMHRSRSVDRLLARFERPRSESFELGDPERPASRATAYLLARVDGVGVAENRRASYRRLLEEFAAYVPAPFDDLPAGACPLFFPVSMTEGLDLHRVRGAGVAAEPFWPKLHPLLPKREFPRAVAWHGRFVALPVHQGLRPADVERIASALRGARRASGGPAPPLV